MYRNEESEIASYVLHNVYCFPVYVLYFVLQIKEM
jgi:hypothetical protein